MKKLILAVTVAVLLLCFCACSKEKLREPVTNTEKSSGEALPSEKNEYSIPLSGKCSGDKGEYSLEPNFEFQDSYELSVNADEENKYYSLMYFTDFSSGTKVVLCNKPDCSHTDNTCNALFPCAFSLRNEKGITRFPCMTSHGYVFFSGERLYVFNSFGELISMNKDGTEHKRLAALDGKYTVTTGFLQGESIYLAVKYLPDYDPQVEQEFSDGDYQEAFVEINIKNGRVKECFNFKPQAQTLPLGIYKDKVYYFYKSPNTLASAKTQQEVDNEENGHDVSLFCCNISGGERTDLISPVKSFEADNAILINSAIYYQNRSEGKIVRLDLDTGETAAVLSDITGYIEMLPPEKENTLRFTRLNTLTFAFAQEPQTNQTFCLDLLTGELSEINETAKGVR